METSRLCRYPARDGVYYPRCRAIIIDRKTKQLRQCRHSVLPGSDFCESNHRDRDLLGTVGVEVPFDDD